MVSRLFKDICCWCEKLFSNIKQLFHEILGNSQIVVPR